MKTRNGKIARLPKTIREELNHRLEDGNSGPGLLEWLNSLPEVQTLLEAEFNSQPINETNLTAWRQGGYLDWIDHQEARDQLHLMIERGCDLEKEEIDGSICDRLARIATIELAGQFRQLNAIEDPDKRWKKFREVSRELSRLQNGAHFARHVQLAWNRWEAELRQKEVARAEQRAEGTNLLAFLQNLAANASPTRHRGAANK